MFIVSLENLMEFRLSFLVEFTHRIFLLCGSLILVHIEWFARD